MSFPMTGTLQRNVVFLFTIFVLLGTVGSCASKVDYSYDETDEQEYLGRILGSATDHSVDLLALSPELKSILDREIKDSLVGRSKLKRLRELMFGEDELNIHYNASVTLTASETFVVGQGNCLSMTSLFIGAARYIGLDARYQTVEVDPTWDHDGNTMVRYQHIVATGEIIGGSQYVVDFLPEFVIGDMRAKVIPDREAKALYFNNLGAEGIVDGSLDDAIKYLRFAIRLQPDFSDAWTNMGAAQRRSEQYDLAEFSYQRALQQDPGNYSALSNLGWFYQFRGRDREAAEIVERVHQYRDRNPYFHYFKGRVAFEQGAYQRALDEIQKSVKLKRDEPDFYTTLAQIHERIGDTEQSRKMLALADRYKSAELKAPERRMNHRYWTMSTTVLPTP